MEAKNYIGIAKRTTEEELNILFRQTMVFQEQYADP